MRICNSFRCEVLALLFLEVELVLLLKPFEDAHIFGISNPSMPTPGRVDYLYT